MGGGNRQKGWVNLLATRVSTRQKFDSSALESLLIFAVLESQHVVS